mmetsp:Transcript_43559/g.78341  ORF Transcript_43559/g.78341 Transcript_43559/m.78341 type:complete len:222 (-) Transcript_43559:1584-2249(-)
MGGQVSAFLLGCGVLFCGVGRPGTGPGGPSASGGCWPFFFLLPFEPESTEKGLLVRNILSAGCTSGFPLPGCHLSFVSGSAGRSSVALALVELLLLDTCASALALGVSPLHASHNRWAPGGTGCWAIIFCRTFSVMGRVRNPACRALMQVIMTAAWTAACLLVRCCTRVRGVAVSFGTRVNVGELDKRSSAPATSSWMCCPCRPASNEAAAATTPAFIITD